LPALYVTAIPAVFFALDSSTVLSIATFSNKRFVAYTKHKKTRL